MKKVLITGANGFIGRHLVDSLAAADWQIFTLERDNFGADRLAICRDTLLRPTVEALAGLDVVVHLAGIAHRHASPEEIISINQNWPQQLYLAAIEAGVSRFVWLSSIKVLGESSSRPLTVEAPYAPADAYGRSKMEAEKALMNAAGTGGTELAIIRPPLVYGPGVKANFLLLLRLARLNRLGLPLPLGAARALRSFVGVRNLVDLITLLAQQGSGIFHVADPEDLSVVDLLRRLGARNSLILSVPSAAMRRMADWFGQQAVYQRLFESLQLDQAVTMASLGWQPPFSVGQQLDETMKWYLQSH